MTPKSDLDRAIEVVEARLERHRNLPDAASSHGQAAQGAAEGMLELVITDLRALKEESKG